MRIEDTRALPGPGLLFWVAALLLVVGSLLATAGGIAFGVSLILFIASTLLAGTGCVSAFHGRRTAVRVITSLVGGGVWLLIGGALYLLMLLSSLSSSLA
jgi:hypothetical protein